MPSGNHPTVYVVALVIVAIIVGLVLRYGATTVPLAADATTGISNALDALTLSNAGGNYPYEGPTGG